MADYTGSHCIVCEKTFEKNDDIVVCPQCGTPYHRQCYLDAGTCVNKELHESGGSWSKAPAAGGENGEIGRCPRCGKDVPPLALFCESCGMPIASEEQVQGPQTQPGAADPYNDFGNPFNAEHLKVNFSDPLCGMNPEEDFDGVRLADLADYVGKNTFYFLPVFKRMKESGRKVTWNFPAMLVPPMYFAYRKMFSVMALLMVVSVITNIPGLIFTFARMGEMAGTPLDGFLANIDVYSGSFGMLNTVCYIISWAVRLITGAFANWFYYQHCVRKVKKLKEAGAPKETFQKKGGVSTIALSVILLLPLITSFISAFTLMFAK